jgi:hypothetical protein
MPEAPSPPINVRMTPIWHDIRKSQNHLSGALTFHWRQRCSTPALLYGSSSYALVDAPYPADLQAAAKAGTLKPNDDTWQNPSAYFAAGGIISTADDLATWIRALVGGKIFNARLSAPMDGEPRTGGSK